MSRAERFRIFGIILAVLASATAVFAATYFLTALIYRAMAWQPAPFLAQMITCVVGLIFCFVIIYIFAYTNRAKRFHIEMKIFGPIFEAMGRIAKGDFNVKIEEKGPDNPLMNELTRSVNNMALELNQLEAMRQEFISNVSHEIQSPLTSIRGFARALQNDELAPTERSHYLTVIETESVRLSKLADNLLKLASLESEQVKFEPKPYRLDKQIRNLVLMCEPQWMEKAIQMEVSLAETTITADEELLSQVWINLIHNSIKFTPSGGKVYVELCQKEKQIEFRISDTGIGITEEDQAHIFERFYKADKARQRSIEGSGLGLSIASKIIEMHQGTICVKSAQGVGATLIVSLPLNVLPVPAE